MVEQSIEKWMEGQLAASKGARTRKLKEGLGHAGKMFLNNVWCPAIGSFEHLFAEYEVRDFKDGIRFIDFAYIRGYLRICIEIDGYGPHCRDMTREQFIDERERQNDLMNDGWKVYRFAFDLVDQNPRRCQKTIHQIMGRWFGELESDLRLSSMEQDVVRLALGAPHPFTRSDVSDRLGVGVRYGRSLIASLVSKQVLIPASGKTRIRKYMLNPGKKDSLIF
jgi:hypothetical protein